MAQSLKNLLDRGFVYAITSVRSGSCIFDGIFIKGVGIWPWLTRLIAGDDISFGIGFAIHVVVFSVKDGRRLGGVPPLGYPVPPEVG